MPQKNAFPPSDPASDLDARRRALYVLEHLDGRPVQAVLNTVLAAPPELSPQRRALCSELVYGSLRMESRLNLVLERFLAHPAKTPPRLKRVLHMALYGLLSMTRTPRAYTVDVNVNLVREVCGAGLAKVANGVLRAFLRSPWAEMEPETLTETLCAEAGGGLAGLAAACGLPLWMLELWEQGYGEAAPCALAAMRTPWPCVRVNALREDAQTLRESLLEIGGEPVGAWGVRFMPGARPQTLETLLLEGRLSRQGEGSQLLLDVMQPFLRGRVWDACAGFGGKTLALLERGASVVAASDTHAGRLKGLREDAARLHVPPPPLFLASAAQPPLREGEVDSVLLDVPCSGLGTLARRPDLRRQRQPEHLAELIALQRAMLNAAWPLIPCGGTVIYVTCALNPAENEKQIARFLDAHADAALMLHYDPGPDEHGSDLLYGAALQKS